MHSYKGKQGTTFHYNSDFGGGVIIVRDGLETIIPATDILEFVACGYVLQHRIASLEQTSWKDLLTPPERISAIDADIIAILQKHLYVTDEWDGNKLASWQWGNHVFVGGIDEAAAAIAKLEACEPK